MLVIARNPQEQVLIETPAGPIAIFAEVIYGVGQDSLKFYIQAPRECVVSRGPRLPPVGGVKVLDQALAKARETVEKMAAEIAALKAANEWEFNRWKTEHALVKQLRAQLNPRAA